MATTHTAQPGETIASIAEATGIDADELFAANRDALGSTPANLTPGMELTIPETAASASPEEDHLEVGDGPDG